VDAIIFEAVTKHYRDPSFRYVFKPRLSVGIESVSFKVASGETFGILGLNGAGKTTAFKLMLGLLRPDEGSVSVGGFNLPDERARALSLVGYLPEISYFQKNLSVFETMKFLLELSSYGKPRPSPSGELSFLPDDDKHKKKNIFEILDLVGLGAVADRKVGKLSKGMMQRLGIAQSLVNDPRILIYDEPTSGLDPLGIKEMRGILERLKRSGKTIIFSSHITSEVEKLCDRVAILHKGRLIKIIEQRDFADGSGSRLEEIFVGAVSE